MSDTAQASVWGPLRRLAVRAITGAPRASALAAWAFAFAGHAAAFALVAAFTAPPPPAPLAPAQPRVLNVTLVAPKPRPEAEAAEAPPDGGADSDTDGEVAAADDEDPAPDTFVFTPRISLPTRSELSAAIVTATPRQSRDAAQVPEEVREALTAYLRCASDEPTIDVDDPDCAGARERLTQFSDAGAGLASAGFLDETVLRDADLVDGAFSRLMKTIAQTARGHVIDASIFDGRASGPWAPEPEWIGLYEKNPLLVDPRLYNKDGRDILAPPRAAPTSEP